MMHFIYLIYRIFWGIIKCVVFFIAMIFAAVFLFDAMASPVCNGGDCSAAHNVSGVATVSVSLPELDLPVAKSTVAVITDLPPCFFRAPCSGTDVDVFINLEPAATTILAVCYEFYATCAIAGNLSARVGYTCRGAPRTCWRRFLGALREVGSIDVRIFPASGGASYAFSGRSGVSEFQVLDQGAAQEETGEEGNELPANPANPGAVPRGTVSP